MTDPRLIEPGKSYLITRRCSQRQFLLTPSPIVVQIFLYVLGFLAQKHGIVLHAFVMMSNHYHLVLTDVRGVLPKFTQDLNSLLARVLNALRGRRENFWSSDKPSYVTLEAIEDILRKCAYVLTNPVASGLVRSRKEWPGAISRVEQIDGEVLTIKKPRFFFGKSFPEFVEIRLVPPPDLGELSAEEFQSDLLDLTEARQEELQEERAREGKGYLGRKKVLEQSAFDAPKGAGGYSGEHTSIAAQDDETRREAIERLKRFISEYRAALAEFRAGNRDVVFPAGTWKMRVLFGVRCEPFADQAA